MVYYINYICIFSFDQKFNNHKDYPKLGNWVKAQRQLYNKDALSEDRIEKLLGIGFNWKVDKRGKKNSPNLLENKQKAIYMVLNGQTIFSVAHKFKMHRDTLGRYVDNEIKKAVYRVIHGEEIEKVAREEEINIRLLRRKVKEKKISTDSISYRFFKPQDKKGDKDRDKDKDGKSGRSISRSSKRKASFLQERELSSHQK